MGLVSGTFLSINEKILYAIPIIILILPSLNSLIGDISTVLVSRLTTHLYIGTIPAKLKISDRITQDFYGLLLTTLLSLIFLVVLGYSIRITIVTDIEIVNPFMIILIIGATIFLLFGILFVILFAFSILFFRKGKDPNNFLIPFVTSLADFLTPLFLIIFIQIFLLN